MLEALLINMNFNNELDIKISNVNGINIETVRNCKMVNKDNIYILNNKYLFKDYKYIEITKEKVKREEYINQEKTLWENCYNNNIIHKDPEYKFYSDEKKKQTCYKEGLELIENTYSKQLILQNIYFEKNPTNYVNCQSIKEREE